MTNQPDLPAEPGARRERPVHPLDRVPPPPHAEAPPPPPRPTRRVEFPSSPPVVTYTLLTVNVLAFLVDFGLKAMGYGAQGVGPLTLYGAKDNAAILNGQLWRFVTPLFLHGGLLHIGFNSYFLYLVGRRLEARFGTARFLALYILSGVGGVLASFAFSQYNSIGASSALFGLIGAWIPMLARNREVLADTRRQIWRIIEVIGINLVISFTPGIDIWAHVGGLLAGLALGWLITPRYAVSVPTPDLIRVEDRSSPGAVWLATAAFAGALIMLIGLVMRLKAGAFGV
jgi:rhomboid protease GluP